MRSGWACLALLAAAGCTDAAREDARRKEVERAVAEAEGAPPVASAEPARGYTPLAITREPESAPAAPEPPTPAVSAWAASIGRDIDTIDRRSRQALTIDRLRGDRDPRQKGHELMAIMQWCDEGSLEACLSVGHKLLFGECLFDRARGFYEKAASLAQDLPPPAVDHFTVEGQPQRQDLRTGLRFSDPALRDDQQVRGVAAVCGQIAERDRPHWDAFFAEYGAGAATPAATPSTPEERLGLGFARRRMILAAEERIAGLGGLHAGTAAELRKRLASSADDLCAGGDAQTCATASFLHAMACRLPQMEDAYRRFQSELEGLDAAGRARALEAARDVVGPARTYVEGDANARDLVLRSLCGRASGDRR